MGWITTLRGGTVGGSPGSYCRLRHVPPQPARLSPAADVFPEDGPEHAAGFRWRGEVHAERLAAPRVWTAPDGSAMRARRGDWWVRDEGGNERSVSDAEFRATHQQVEGDRWLRTGEV